MPSAVMLLRHAEKPIGHGAPDGVTIEGALDPESLTPRGWQRAGALVPLFVSHCVDAAADRLPTPTHLFASQIVGNNSKRPRETLLPLGQRLGLVVDSRFAKEEVGALVRAIQGIEGVVLVAWEHRMIPSIANLLAGDPSSVPQVWPDDRYDIIWVLETPLSGPTGFRQVPQMLLAGDRPAPIGTTPPNPT